MISMTLRILRMSIHLTCLMSLNNLILHPRSLKSVIEEQSAGQDLSALISELLRHPGYSDLGRNLLAKSTGHPGPQDGYDRQDRHGRNDRHDRHDRLDRRDSMVGGPEIIGGPEIAGVLPRGSEAEANSQRKRR
jgi:hypothetical protein